LLQTCHKSVTNFERIDRPGNEISNDNERISFPVDFERNEIPGNFERNENLSIITGCLPAGFRNPKYILNADSRGGPSHTVKPEGVVQGSAVF
jgi:hypothetical protein